MAELPELPERIQALIREESASYGALVDDDELRRAHAAFLGRAPVRVLASPRPEPNRYPVTLWHVAAALLVGLGVGGGAVYGLTRQGTVATVDPAVGGMGATDAAFAVATSVGTSAAPSATVSATPAPPASSFRPEPRATNHPVPVGTATSLPLPQASAPPRPRGTAAPR